MSHEQLSKILQASGATAIAVSGGIDSLTLACVATDICPDTMIFHALSPAVPEVATKRVRQYAKDRHWKLSIVNAGEFTNPDYLKNPINRCFYCKNSLYARIAQNSDLPIFSGTNLDDLDDFRPGLKAAEKHKVRHPYVEALMGKEDIRATARKLGLNDIENLSASPCLSSRVTTGIMIAAEELHLIDLVETTLRSIIGDVPIRCRRLPDGYQIQIDAEELKRMNKSQYESLQVQIQPLFKSLSQSFLGIVAYTRGSAFVAKKNV